MNHIYYLARNRDDDANDLEIDGSTTTRTAAIAMEISGYYNVCRHHAAMLLPDNHFGVLKPINSNTYTNSKSIGTTSGKTNDHKKQKHQKR